MWAALRKNGRRRDSTAESGEPPGSTTDEGRLDPAAGEFSPDGGAPISSGSRRSLQAAVASRSAPAASPSPGPSGVSGTNRPVSSEWAIRLTGRDWDGAAAVGPAGIGGSGRSDPWFGPLG